MRATLGRLVRPFVSILLTWPLFPSSASTVSLPAVAAVLLAVVFYWLAGVERRLLSVSMPVPSPSDYESAFVVEEPLQP